MMREITLASAFAALAVFCTAPYLNHDPEQDYFGRNGVVQKMDRVRSSFSDKSVSTQRTSRKPSKTW
jgi:hypothetical protein